MISAECAVMCSVWGYAQNARNRARRQCTGVVARQLGHLAHHTGGGATFACGFICVLTLSREETAHGGGVLAATTGTPHGGNGCLWVRGLSVGPWFCGLPVASRVCSHVQCMEVRVKRKETACGLEPLAGTPGEAGCA